MPKKTTAELLDEMLAQQDRGTFVDPVQSAKAFLSKRSVVDDANAFAASEAAADREMSVTPMQRYGQVAKDTASAMAIPLSFAGGPVGMVAGGALALEGINSAMKDPSVGNVGMAALGTLPFVKPVKQAVQNAKTANNIGRMRATEGAGDMGATFSREKPYRAGGGVSSGSVERAPGPTRSGHVVGHDRHVGTPPRYTGNGSNVSAGDLRAEAQVPINWRKPPSTFEQAMNTDAPSMSVVDEAPVPQNIPAAGEVADVLAGLGARLDEIPTRQRARPAPDYVHPVDTSGAEFGFEELPEISESELTRLQELFKRLGL